MGRSCLKRLGLRKLTEGSDRKTVNHGGSCLVPVPGARFCGRGALVRLVSSTVCGCIRVTMLRASSAGALPRPLLLLYKPNGVAANGSQKICASLVRARLNSPTHRRVLNIPTFLGPFRHIFGHDRHGGCRLKTQGSLVALGRCRLKSLALNNTPEPPLIF